MVISPVGEIARHLGTKVEASRIAVEAFAALLDNPVTGIAYPSKAEIRATLRGHDLGCWCPVTMPDQDSPRGLVRYPCHRWPLMEVANA
jgi:hypothetical protein